MVWLAGHGAYKRFFFPNMALRTLRVCYSFLLKVYIAQEKIEHHLPVVATYGGVQEAAPPQSRLLLACTERLLSCEHLVPGDHW
jgi:hypothetical protein